MTKTRAKRWKTCVASHASSNLSKKYYHGWHPEDNGDDFSDEGNAAEDEHDGSGVTYDDLTRRPVLGFFGGRSVGVAARDPPAELSSRWKDHATGDTAESTSS
jgi:hypothetical protein